jgi:hypothetical protein
MGTPEKVERCSEWRKHGEWSYALGRDAIKQPLLLRRRPEADGPRIEAAVCSGTWPLNRELPEHDSTSWHPAMLSRSAAA